MFFFFLLLSGRCKANRDKKYLKKWKLPDPYTGLKQRPDQTLRLVFISIYCMELLLDSLFLFCLCLPMEHTQPSETKPFVCFTISWTFFHIFHIFIFCLWCLFLPFYISFSLWIPEEGFPSYSISRLSQYPIGHKICLQVLLKCNLSSSLQELDIVNCAMYSI